METLLDDEELQLLDGLRRELAEAQDELARNPDDERAARKARVLSRAVGSVRWRIMTTVPQAAGNLALEDLLGAAHDFMLSQLAAPPGLPGEPFIRLALEPEGTRAFIFWGPARGDLRNVTGSEVFDHDAFAGLLEAGGAFAAVASNNLPTETRAKIAKALEAGSIFVIEVRPLANAARLCIGSLVGGVEQIVPVAMSYLPADDEPGEAIH